MFKKTKVCSGLMLAFGGTLALMTLPALAQQELQRVEITGSSIKRLEGETAAPVQVITRKDIERTGSTSVEQLLRTISAVSSSNSTAGANASGATTGGISTVSLRGLSGDRTLVLVNGKRITAYGAPNTSVAVDVDSIPVAAIERVEVLKDGASAIYGSDAVAGVVNFILRKDYKGAEGTVGYGAGWDGKGSVSKVSALAGFGDLSADHYNVMFLVSHQRDDSLYGRDRDFANTSIHLEADQNGASSRTVPGNINIPGVRGTRNPMVSNGVGNCGPLSVYVPSIAPNYCLFDVAKYVALLPKTERTGVMTSGRLNISEALELYGDISFTRKEANTVIQPSPIDVAFNIPFTLRPSSPYYPTAFVTNLTGGATPNLRVRYRPFITGQRDLTDSADNTRLVLGGQGLLAGWDYDASFLYSGSKVTEKLNGGYFRINGSPSTGPGMVPLLNTGLVNPFGDNTPDIIAQARATNFVGDAFKTKTSLTGIQGKASREIAQLAGGGAGLALGFELRREGYKLDSAPALATGDISGYGGNFAPIDAKRNVGGLYSELQLPVSKSLEVDAAARYDRYAATTNPGNRASTVATLQTFQSVNGDALPQDVVNRIANEAQGNAPAFGKATGKLGLRFKVSPEFLLRATASTGYRAPSLLDLYGPLLSGVTAVINDPVRCATTKSADDCATQFNQYTGGRSTVKPEESRNITAGFVLEPSKNFSASVDYYFTSVKNMITQLAPDYILAHESQFPGRVTRGAPDIAGLPGPIIAIDQRQENLNKVYISGVDVDLRSRVDTSMGLFTLAWDGAYMSRWDSQNPDGSYSSFLANSSATVSGVNPHLKHSTTIAWNRGPWTLSGTYNWMSGFKDVCGNLAQDDFGNCPAGTERHSGTLETFDAQARYDYQKTLSLTVGAKNLLNRAPPYANGTGGAFQSGYDPTYVDPRGRFLYMSVTYKFF